MLKFSCSRFLGRVRTLWRVAEEHGLLDVDQRLHLHEAQVHLVVLRLFTRRFYEVPAALVYFSPDAHGWLEGLPLHLKMMETGRAAGVLGSAVGLAPQRVSATLRR